MLKVFILVEKLLNSVGLVTEVDRKKLALCAQLSQLICDSVPIP